ncbi:hypothetical protein B0O80DRAFT_499298 [Mortierella sp. GBAus27b]|nr:hypothetical protein BGX31_009572 [Mortierella sp. GBA43]KAI8352589.1 hypothetical protein B0O80DRAFT_499298 [Mortierella sp. GBAus27b]
MSDESAIASALSNAGAATSSEPEVEKDKIRQNSKLEQEICDVMAKNVKLEGDLAAQRKGNEKLKAEKEKLEQDVQRIRAEERKRCERKLNDQMQQNQAALLSLMNTMNDNMSKLTLMMIQMNKRIDNLSAPSAGATTTTTNEPVVVKEPVSDEESPTPKDEKPVIADTVATKDNDGPSIVKGEGSSGITLDCVEERRHPLSYVAVGGTLSF